MQRFLMTATLVLGLGFSAMPLQSAEETKVDAESIAKLIKQLGADDFTAREDACKALAKVGIPALEQLKKAVKESKDEEVKSKATQLVTLIQAKADSERLLKATRVHLAYKDTPLAEALKDFSAKSGFQLVYNDDPAKLADRKITLDTGDVTFWEAFDQFCEKSGLTPGVLKQAGGQGGGQGGVPPAPPIQVFPVPVREVVPKAAPADPVKGDRAPNADEAGEDQDDRDAEKREAEEAKKAAEQKARIKAIAKQQAQVQIIVNGIGMPVPGMPQTATANRTIVLGDGKHDKLPTCYSGAARIRIFTNEMQKRPDGELHLPLDFSLEPRMTLQRIAKIQLAKAIDDSGKNLPFIEDKPIDDDMNQLGGIGGIIMPFPGQEVGRPVAKVKGGKGVKSIKELVGTAHATVLPEAAPIFTVDNILKANGKSVDGTLGGTMKITDVRTDKDGRVQIRVQVELPQNVVLGEVNKGGAVQGGPGIIMPGGRGIQIMPAVPPVQIERDGEPNAQVADEAPPAAPVPVPIGRRGRPVRPPIAGQQIGTAFKLVDGKNVEFKNVTTQHPTQVANNGNVTWEYRLTFEPVKDQGEASKLILTGSKPTTIEIPFQFKDVPLS